MRLNFRLPDDIHANSRELIGAQRPRVVAKRSATGVASLQRCYDGAALAPDESLIELAPKNGRWILITDAWFFRESEATRWKKARYGEFRVMPDGRALLVGLCGANLENL